MSRPETRPERSFDGLNVARSAEQDLAAAARHFREIGADHPDHVHHLFAELYLVTTQRWLADLSQDPDNAFSYRVIRRFMDFYLEQVPGRLHAPLHEIEPHWRPYHWLARQQTIRSPITAHLILISAGVKAHIQGDLGRSIRSIEAEMGLLPDESGRRPHAAQDRLLSLQTDVLFLDAALAYVSRQHDDQRGWRRLVLKLYRMGLILLKPIWIPVLQKWRRAGYAKAERSHDPDLADPRPGDA